MSLFWSFVHVIEIVSVWEATGYVYRRVKGRKRIEIARKKS